MSRHAAPANRETNRRNITAEYNEAVKVANALSRDTGIESWRLLKPEATRLLATLDALRPMPHTCEGQPWCPDNWQDD